MVSEAPDSRLCLPWCRKQQDFSWHRPCSVPKADWPVGSSEPDHWCELQEREVVTHNVKP